MTSRAIAPVRSVRALIAGACLAASLGCGGGVGTPVAREFLMGERILGNGLTRAFVTLDSQGNPTALGVRVSEASLTGLPGTRVWLPFSISPAAAPTGFGHLLLTVKPPPATRHGVAGGDGGERGHGELGVHFYLISETEREAINVMGADAMIASRQPEARFIPRDYVPAGDPMDRMGWHWVDPTASGNAPAAPAASLIYGFHDGRLIFIEPTVDIDALTPGIDLDLPVKQPQSFLAAGSYPTRYVVRHDMTSEDYVIAIAGLTPRP